MTPKALLSLLQQVAGGQLDVEGALDKLRQLPFESLGFARVDHHRELRQGMPEVVFGAAKTPAQLVEIARALLEEGSNVLCTRVAQEGRRALCKAFPDAQPNDLARVVTIIREPAAVIGHVGIVCAGTSDLPVVEEAAVTASFLGAEVTILTDVGVAGLHRLFEAREQLHRPDVSIVVAGMEGALPSVVGGLVRQPVIAVPTSICYGASFGGIAALLGMLNSCAAGVTVVNIDNGFGAAAAAHRILMSKARA